MNAAPWVAAGASVLEALIRAASSAGDSSSAKRLEDARSRLLEGLEGIEADEQEVDAEIARMRGGT